MTATTASVFESFILASLFGADGRDRGKRPVAPDEVERRSDPDCSSHFAACSTDDIRRGVDHLAFQPGHILALMQLRAIFAAVAAVQLLIVVTGTVTIAREARTTTPSDDDVPSPAYSEAEAQAATFPRALLDRLPGVIGPDICVLETEDQDLRVHAGGGSALILMRMADAVGMIDLRLDAQVHRPWWVAQAAVTGLNTERHRLTLRLSSKSAVPVGRTFHAAV